MTDAIGSDGLKSVTIKRKSKKKAGFEVEKREEDGFYYITKVPKNCIDIAVGDRVLEINGTMHEDFKSQTNANDLVDSLKLDVIPVEDDDTECEEEEENQEVTQSRSVAKNIPTKDRAKSYDVDQNQNESMEDEFGYGEDWNDKEEMKADDHVWTDKVFNTTNNGPEMKTAGYRDGINKQKSWDRPYVSQYKPRDRFMITVTKAEEKRNNELGIELIEFETGEIYVSEVDEGPFYETALNRGDKVLSINGKKIPDHIDKVEEAVEILESKSKLTIFVLRPSKKDKGYRWIIENSST